MQKNQNGFGLILVVIVIEALMLLAGVSWRVLQANQNNPKSSTASSPEPKSYACDEPLTSELKSEITIGKDCFVKITGTGLAVGITEFHNSPCSEGTQCIWSGVGIDFEYRLNGEVKKGTNLVQAFGYKTNILATNHETYAKLSIEKIK